MGSLRETSERDESDGVGNQIQAILQAGKPVISWVELVGQVEPLYGELRAGLRNKESGRFKLCPPKSTPKNRGG